MADLRITELPIATTPLNGTEPMVIVQGGVTKQTEISNLVNAYTTVIKLAYQDLSLTIDSSLVQKQTAIASYLEGYDKKSNETLIVKLFEPNVNLGLELDWSGQGVTDQASFETWFDANTNSTSLIIEYFSLVGNLLNLELTTNSTTLDLSNTGLINIHNLESLIALTSINLQLNGLTNADYTLLETWANNQTDFTSPCAIDFSLNTDSITGTDLETILLTKNATIIP